MSLIPSRHLTQIRQRWWVVALVAALAMLAAVSSLLMHPTTYVGKSTLMVSGGSVEQDNLLLLGYLSIFNDPATKDLLRSAAKLPEDVTFEARAAAASSIVIIEATADNPTAAQDASQRISDAFSNFINVPLRSGRENSIAEMEGQLKVVSPLAADGSTNDYYVLLQQRIDEARGNSANEVHDLQRQAGVTKNAPHVVFGLVQGAVGGLLLGVLAALGLAAVSTRLASSAELWDKTGVEPLAEVPAAGSVEQDRLREDRLRGLANIVSLQDLPKPTVIAMTDSRGGRGARDIAEALAELSAQQGSRTVLVYADNDPSARARGPGFNDALADSGLIPGLLKDGAVDSLKILRSGSILADRYSLLTRERVAAVLDELRTGADTIIVSAPSIADLSETQLLCAAADVTILVATRRSSRARDVTSAAEKLAKAHAILLGAVLVDRNRKHRDLRPAGSQAPRASSSPRTERVEEHRGTPQQSATHRAAEPVN